MRPLHGRPARTPFQIQEMLGAAQAFGQSLLNGVRPIFALLDVSCRLIRYHR